MGCCNPSYCLDTGSAGKWQYANEKRPNEEQAVSRGPYIGFTIMAPRPGP